MDTLAPMARSRQRDPVALTFAVLFSLFAVSPLALSAVSVGQQAWLRAGWWGLMCVAFLMQALMWWRMARSVITVDALRVSRTGPGGEVWRVPRADIEQALVVRAWGRPYLVLVSRDPAVKAPMCRWFLGVDLPKNAAVGPIDPAALEAILAALGSGSPSSTEAA